MPTRSICRSTSSGRCEHGLGGVDQFDVAEGGETGDFHGFWGWCGWQGMVGWDQIA